MVLGQTGCATQKAINSEGPVLVTPIAETSVKLKDSQMVIAADSADGVTAKILVFKRNMMI